MMKVQNFNQVNSVSCPLSIAIKCMQTHTATNSAKANVAHPAFSPARVCSLLVLSDLLWQRGWLRDLLVVADAFQVRCFSFPGY